MINVTQTYNWCEFSTNYTIGLKLQLINVTQTEHKCYSVYKRYMFYFRYIIAHLIRLEGKELIVIRGENHSDRSYPRSFNSNSLSPEQETISVESSMKKCKRRRIVFSKSKAHFKISVFQNSEFWCESPSQRCRMPTKRAVGRGVPCKRYGRVVVFTSTDHRSHLGAGGPRQFVTTLC